MSTLDNDIKLARDAINGYGREDFNFIYIRSNESLNQLFNLVDVEDKDVLTVLASSDQYFMAAKHKAKHIDTFDINPLTARYFYLRKWLMRYKIYDIYNLKTSEVKKILDRIVPLDEEEKENLIFWNKVVKMITDMYIADNRLFEKSYKHDEELPQISKKALRGLKPNFYHYNIYSDTSINTSRQYDRIFISNILDYHDEHKNGEEYFIAALHNLDCLLKQSGEIIGCTWTKGHVDVMDHQKIFSKVFDTEVLDVQDLNGCPIYYKYVRK